MVIFTTNRKYISEQIKIWHRLVGNLALPPPLNRNLIMRDFSVHWYCTRGIYTYCTYCIVFITEHVMRHQKSNIFIT